MKKYEAGFIGAGNMGGALALAAAKRVSGGRVAVSCSNAESTRAAAERLGCCANANVTAQELDGFKELLSLSGTVDALEERLIDAASAISGCGPAYAYMFIEALADGGVKCGLPRAKAIRYAAQMLCGSAQMVLSSGKHPELLKDEVCSPGGSTIAGVYALEKAGLRAGCIAAVEAAYVRTKELG